MSQGKIIVIEGADGTGKQTITQMVFNQLNLERPLGPEIEFLTRSFPNYDAYYGQQVRHYLHGDDADELVRVPQNIRDDPFCASLAYAADRYIAFRDYIRPQLEQGKWFLLDRYTLSNAVHQGAKIIDPSNRTNFVHRLGCLEYDYFGLPRPSLVIILDLPDDVRRERINKRRADAGDSGRDIHEQDDAYMDTVAALYRSPQFGLTEHGSSHFVISGVEGSRELTPSEMAEDVYRSIVGFHQL